MATNSGGSAMKRISGIFSNFKEFVSEEIFALQDNDLFSRGRNYTLDSDLRSNSSTDLPSMGGKDDKSKESKSEQVETKHQKKKRKAKEKARQKSLHKEEKKAKKRAEKEHVSNTIQSITKYSQWATYVEKRSRIIIEHIKATIDIESETEEHTTKSKKELSPILHELIAFLDVNVIIYPDYSATSKSFRNTRDTISDLWEVLLVAIDKSTDDLLNYYKIILGIMKRVEFDNSHLVLDVHEKPIGTEAELRIAHRYRRLLYATQQFVNSKISKGAKHFSKSHNLYVFCARVLSITFFRIPIIGEMIVQTFALEPEQTVDFVNTYEREQSCQWPLNWQSAITEDPYIAELELQQKPISQTSSNSKENIESPLPRSSSEKSPKSSPLQKSQSSPKISISHSMENDKKSEMSPQSSVSSMENNKKSENSNAVRAAAKSKLYSSFPVLFKWTSFHAALKSCIDDDLDEKLYESNPDWRAALKKRDQLFLVFLKEWVGYIRSCTDSNTVALDGSEIVVHSVHGNIQWEFIRGYSELLHAFLYELKCSESINKQMMDASLVMLSTNSVLINIYLRILFSRTNVCVANQVIDTLNMMESWFKEIRLYHGKLPYTFDAEFFNKGLRIIIAREHHQLIAKLLSILYNYSDIFSGDLRVAVYCDLLINEFFFSLFLNWDDNVRNSYQQILVFKLIRMRRSEIHALGLITVEELSAKELGKTMTIRGKQHVPVEEKDQIIDAMMFAKVEHHVKLVQDQLRGTSMNRYDKGLEVYVPKALSEYKYYMSRYYSWERSGEVEPPRLVPIHMLSENEID